MSLFRGDDDDTSNDVKKTKQMLSSPNGKKNLLGTAIMAEWARI